MNPSQDSYIFANFYRDTGNLDEFRVRTKLGLSKRVFSSRIDRIIYSMDRKISISRTRKESCLKMKPLSVTLHQYKLQPTNGSITLRPSLAKTYRKIKSITKQT
jgi:hypothetical protein